MPIKTAITRQCSRLLTVAADFVVRREQREKTVPAERSALSFAKRAWPGA
jgi:hypothetical protein